MFKKDGIIRCASRLQNIDNFDMANPIYLPYSHKITELIIMLYHKMNLHSGAQHLLAQIRRKYFIPKALQMIKIVIKKCTGCQKYKAKPYALPTMPPHPDIRVNRFRVFENIGLDYIGPVTIKNDSGHNKVWILIITCFNTRAVHLEVITDLSADKFINGFRRYIARRGKPSTVLSDNGTQFQLGEKVLRLMWSNLIKTSEIHTYFSKEGIEWKFITPLSPFKGAIYERLVQIFKNAFRKSIGRKILEMDEFNTFIIEIESVMNSRPIAQVSDELDDISILRPIDFIMPYGKTGIPSEEMEDYETDPNFIPKNINSAEKLVQSWKTHLQKLNTFWELWSTNYLTALRERDFEARHKQPRIKNEHKPKIGEIVIINDDYLPRGCWKLGKIQKVYDRAVELLTFDGKN